MGASGGLASSMHIDSIAASTARTSKRLGALPADSTGAEIARGCRYRPGRFQLLTPFSAARSRFRWPPVNRPADTNRMTEYCGADHGYSRVMVQIERRGASSATGFTPTVTAAYADQIRRWHNASYESARALATSTRTFDYLGLTLEVPPEVMPITPLSELLGSAVLAEVAPGDRVLDMGTGSGVNAILAATVASDVVAVDINPRAVETARSNAIRNGVGERVDVRYSDVFSAVEDEFDLIIFDPPSRWFAPRDLLEMASTDEDYRALTTFVRNVDRHLSPTGRLLLFFGTSGDLGYLRQMLAEEGFAVDVCGHREVHKGHTRVHYYTHRVTRIG